MKTRRRVALLFGGPSMEHEVSIGSATEVARAIEMLDTVQATPLYVTREGLWHWPRKAAELSLGARVMASEDPARLGEAFQTRGLAFAQALAQLKDDDFDAVLIMIHGAGGEDGRLQGAFDLAGIAYTGSGAAASALALDKVRCQGSLAARGLPVPEFRAIERGEAADPQTRIDLAETIGFPCVVKPALGGSSVGINISSSSESFDEALRIAFEFGPLVLVEKYIGGRELTCAVVERPEPEALPIIEIIPPEGRFFDYEAKYVAGVSREVCPAEIGDELAARIVTLSLEAHRAIGCEGFSRVDFIADEEGPKILEINTIPGMTATSLMPRAAAVAGISLPELIELILERAIASGKQTA